MRSTTPSAMVVSIKRLAGGAVSGAVGGASAATVTAGRAGAPTELSGKTVEAGGKIGDRVPGVASWKGVTPGTGSLGEATPNGAAPAVVALARDPGAVDVS